MHIINTAGVVSSDVGSVDDTYLNVRAMLRQSQ